MIKEIKYNRLKLEYEKQLESIIIINLTSQTIMYRYLNDIIAYSSKVDYRFQLNFNKFENLCLGAGLSNEDIISIINSKLNTKNYELDILW